MDLLPFECQGFHGCHRCRMAGQCDRMCSGDKTTATTVACTLWLPPQRDIQDLGSFDASHRPHIHCSAMAYDMALWPSLYTPRVVCV